MIGESLPGMPWEERPAGCVDPVWRHSANPIIGWNPSPSCAYDRNGVLFPRKVGGRYLALLGHIKANSELVAGDAEEWR
jgi:hypothetical protein